MPMEDTDIPCPDCGTMLTDVDGMLECQGNFNPDTEQVVGGCGGSTGWTDEDWMVWYPGPLQRANPQKLTLEQRAKEIQK